MLTHRVQFRLLDVVEIVHGSQSEIRGIHEFVLSELLFLLVAATDEVFNSQAGERPDVLRQSARALARLFAPRCQRDVTGDGILTRRRGASISRPRSPRLPSYVALRRRRFRHVTLDTRVPRRHARRRPLLAGCFISRLFIFLISRFVFLRFDRNDDGAR